MDRQMKTAAAATVDLASQTLKSADALTQRARRAISGDEGVLADAEGHLWEALGCLRAAQLNMEIVLHKLRWDEWDQEETLDTPEQSIS